MDYEVNGEKNCNNYSYLFGSRAGFCNSFRQLGPQHFEST